MVEPWATAGLAKSRSSAYRHLFILPDREEFTQLLHGRKIMLRERIHYFRQNNAVAAMGQVGSMVEHVDPDLAVGNDSGDGRLSKHLARSDRRDDQPRLFEKIARRLPGQFQAVFETMDGPFLFQLAESARSPLESLTKPGQSIIKALKAARPSAGGFHTNAIN